MPTAAGYADLSAGPFTLARAREAGLTRATLTRLRNEGSVRRILQNAYVPSNLADSLELRAEALLLVVPQHVVLCDRTAAWLYGVDVHDFAEITTIPRIETCVPPSNTRVRRPQVKGARRDLEPQDVERVHGLLVTTPLRTALDLGCSLRRTGALAAVDSFLRAGYITKDELRAQLVRFRGRRGVVQLRTVVTRASPLAESPGESWTRMIMLDAQLPEPVLQFEILVDGILWYRLDLSYPLCKVCIEYDGVLFHDTPEGRARDRARRAWLRDHGWLVFVVRKEDMGPMEALLWTNKVAQALRERGYAAAA